MPTPATDTYLPFLPDLGGYTLDVTDDGVFMVEFDALGSVERLNPEHVTEDDYRYLTRLQEEGQLTREQREHIESVLEEAFDLNPDLDMEAKALREAREADYQNTLKCLAAWR